MLISPVGRGILAAAGLVVAIVWMSWARLHPASEIVRTTGEVLEVSTTGLASPTSPILRVRLQDGQEARVMLSTFLPEPGAVLPFVVESHGGRGETWVTFDEERWIDGAVVP